MLPPTIDWVGDERGELRLLDQTELPGRQVVLRPRDDAEVVSAIRRLAVRGAPAIGVAAAYGVVLGVRDRTQRGAAFADALEASCSDLGGARPTAVNLAWAIARMRRAGHDGGGVAALLAEARAIHDEDAELCRRMGEAGAELVPEGGTVLTHCNAGRLATAGDGTALAVLFAAHRAGRRFRVLADETRPLLQGSRLTALELHAEGIPVEVIVDGAAAGLIARGEVHLVITGADRIARNGDVANKVGTYGLALAAREHGVPMYVAAPYSTFDLTLADGRAIPIEDRDGGEVLAIAGRSLGAPGVTARNPAFDVTPAHLLTGLITDRGLIAPVTAARIAAVMAG